MIKNDSKTDNSNKWWWEEGRQQSGNALQVTASGASLFSIPSLY